MGSERCPGVAPKMYKLRRPGELAEKHPVIQSRREAYDSTFQRALTFPHIPRGTFKRMLNVIRHYRGFCSMCIVLSVLWNAQD